MTVKLPTVPGKDKQLERLLEGMETAGETARFTRQPSQVVAQFRVVSLHPVGFAFVRHRRMATGRIHQRAIGCEQVAVVKLRLRRFIDHRLKQRLAPLEALRYE